MKFKDQKMKRQQEIFCVEKLTSQTLTLPTSTSPRDMADCAVLSSVDDDFSPNSGMEITIEAGSNNSQKLLGDEDFNIETNEENNQMLEIKSDDLEDTIQHVQGLKTADLENKNDAIEFENNTENARHDNPQPVEGMEFESYDDVYNYYNSYAKELGFGIRVKSSWTKRNSKEKRGAVLCCNCEGFKMMKEANTRRKETRTGCLAMLRLRLVESNRWRLEEVKLDHNHSFDHQRTQNSRSQKKMEAGMKRKLESAVDPGVKTIKLYRTPALNSLSYRSLNERDYINNHADPSKRLDLIKRHDVKAIYSYFHRAQLADPNFFYIMDLSDEGYLRNVFWIESRSRAAYGYFGDVVVVDTTNKCDIPFLSFSGLNHHCRSVLFGCGLIVDDSMETYIWLMRAWLTCMLGRAPQTIITDRCKALQVAISEVFPRANHCFCPPLVVKNIYEKLGKLGKLEVFRTVLNTTVYDSMKVENFELGWDEMTQHFGIKDHEWLRDVYDDREKWVPVYMNNTFFAGVFTFQPEEQHLNLYFHTYLHKQTNLNDFFNCYESLQQKIFRNEACDDLESKEFTPNLKTACSYEILISQLYTKQIFLKFQDEVALTSTCFGVTQIHANGPIVTYMVKERDPGLPTETKNFEVVYHKLGLEVRCVCGCFNFRGYLCRHALSILNYNGIEEIPSQYMLSRWRKDIRRFCFPDFGSDSIDISNPVRCYDHLYRHAVQVVTEAMDSENRRMVAWQAFKESLNKVRLSAEKHL